MNSNKIEGIGLGLRFEHFDDVLSSEHTTPWFEVMVEDFLNEGPHHKKLEKLRESLPIAFHSIGLNLGGCDTFCMDTLSSLKSLHQKFDPCLISDHLCWSSHNGKYHHDLLPVPKTKEGLKNLCERINFLQDFFQRELVVENITSYIDYKNESYSEIEFIKEITRKTGCGLLLDITNVLINHRNRGEDSESYFETYPYESVKQIHLSGYDGSENPVIDAHSKRVNLQDITILKSIYSKGYCIPAMIERDAEIPPFEELESERLSIIEGIK